MTLTDCTREYFTCSDGSCVTMEERCDGKPDCQNGSDEEECDVIITFAGYNKFLVPQPSETKTSLQHALPFLCCVPLLDHGGLKEQKEQDPDKDR